MCPLHRANASNHEVELRLRGELPVPSVAQLIHIAVDMRPIMDSLQLKRASLIGHSIVGAEITRFSARWPVPPVHPSPRPPYRLT